MLKKISCGRNRSERNTCLKTQYDLKTYDFFPFDLKNITNLVMETEQSKKFSNAMPQINRP